MIKLALAESPAAVREWQFKEGQHYVRLLVSFLLLLINGYIFYMSIVFTSIAWVKPTAVLGVSSAVVNSALIVGFGMITLHTLRFIRDDIRIIMDSRT